MPRARGHRAVALRRAVARLTLPVLLLLPALIIIVGLVGYPLARTIYLSFTDTGLGELIYGGCTWVGLENFKEVFTDEHLRRVADQHGRVRDGVRDRDDGARASPSRCCSTSG